MAQHETLALRVAQHGPFIKHGGDDAGAAQALRPDRAAGLKLDKLHIAQLRARSISHGGRVAAGIPLVGGKGVNAAETAAGQHRGRSADEAPGLRPRVESQRAAHAASACPQANRAGVGALVYPARHCRAQGGKRLRTCVVAYAHHARVGGAQRAQELVALALAVEGKAQPLDLALHFRRVAAQGGCQRRFAYALPAGQRIAQKGFRRIGRVRGDAKPMHPGRSALPVVQQGNAHASAHGLAGGHPAREAAAQQQAVGRVYGYAHASQMPPLAMEPILRANRRRKRG